MMLVMDMGKAMEKEININKKKINPEKSQGLFF